MTLPRWATLGARGFVLAYLAVLLAAPVGLVFYRTFEPGLGELWHSVTAPEARHAFWLTIEIAAIAVTLNAVFGVLLALLLARRRFPGKALLNAIVDLPFAVSPVVVGLALLLVYSINEPIGGWLADRGLRVMFATPGMVLATIFVCLPFVVREVTPVLEEVGDEAEQAAATLGAGAWQTFWRITLPAIRWGLTYGIVLSVARAIGEFGAVAVVSGKVVGQTQTMTLLVAQRYTSFDLPGAYAASGVLAVIALATLLAMTAINPRKEHA
ncbi:MAG TPA: sulfate ABC transporter permease subunit [Solirubrobacteraceae bacterium]|nr:sulfate ABC transporter permease subunit [Solirubrobacteraceae bacterium]